MPLTHLNFVASAFFLALGTVLAKALLSGSDAVIDPLPFLTLQLLGGIAFLGVVRVARGWRTEPLPGLARPAVAGLILGLGSVGTIMAIALISASEASVVFATQPVAIVVLAWVLLGERVSPAVFALILLAVAGVTCIVLGGWEAGATGRMAGIAFAAFSTICAAFYVVWMRRLSGHADMLSILIVVQIVAWLVAAAALGTGILMDFTEARAGSAFAILSAVGTGMIYYGLAFYVYLIGLRSTEASTAGVYLSLVPIFAIGLSSVFLSERLSVIQWIGALVVIGALAGVSVLAPRRNNRACDEEA
ncbi:MAG: DMT family transporter [Pseudomonadota bacterium]